MSNGASDHPIIDVLIVGAGLSGIGAAKHLQMHSSQSSWCILESRDAIGGTWDLFRYPGIRSDSDMYTLGYSFKPWIDHKAIADGSTIRQYIQKTADENGITPHIRHGHSVTHASWSSSEACWTLTANQKNNDQPVVLKARFLYLCCGYYSYKNGYQPNFPGQASFKGDWVHPQFWPEKLNYEQKKVVVIGSGATAVTLVPEMAKKAAHVTMLQRSPTYVISLPAEDGFSLTLQKFLPSKLAYQITRAKNVILGMLSYQLARSQPEFVKRYLVKIAAKQLRSDEQAQHFSPDYKPWDQRLCLIPDGDLFKQIRRGHASVVTDTIQTVTEKGLQLSSGQFLEADIIVSATGLSLNMLGDIQVTVDGQAFKPSQAMAYRGMCLSGLPNAIMTFGYTNASWTLKADLTAVYACRLLNYMRQHGYRKVVPVRDASVAEQDYLSFTSGYVQRASSILPKQGSRAPWQVNQNYIKDIFLIKYARLNDGIMQFS
ncbi:FAD-containing monooxygenase EthA [Limnohabitans sp. MMS-10A-178]|nr:NAD(P)/FAD-dependent oxidoreductase [Limnohabitans sp. MMS-10A-178]PUE14228.1 FAD-containing monooxygenase EthA [Limnohabitans sp. MMS-10A-178]